MKLKLALATLALSALTLSGCSNKVVNPSSPPGSPPGTQQSSNVPPETWFAGPDPNDPAAGWLTDAGPFGGLFIPEPATGWLDFPGIPHTMLSAESLLVFPKDRPERRTFFEFYGDKIWLRHEGDTVHINSWAIFPSGGSDPDSPYSVLVNRSLLPYWLPFAPVLMPDTANGSPIGFRLQVELQDVLGRVSRPSESTTYPLFDPASPFHNPVINGYHALIEAGRAYAVARAVDGDEAVDRRIDNRPGGAVGIVERVDAGGGSPEDVALRSKILTFQVDHPPRLLQGNPSFRPPANQVFTTRTPGMPLNLMATDDDPFDAIAYPRNQARTYSHVGGPMLQAPILRRRIAILGKWTGDPSRDTCYVVPGDLMGPVASLAIPDWIANGPITLLIRLCDCFDCNVLPGPGACPAFTGTELHPTFGRCVDTEIPCRLAVPGPVAEAVNGAH